MATFYTHDHRVPKHRVKHSLIVGSISFVVLASTVGIFFLNNKQKPIAITGTAVSVPQKTNPSAYQQIDEPLFSFQLPTDWKQTGFQNLPTLRTISWQSTLKRADNRYLTIYIDTIPATYPVNRELAVTATGNKLTYQTVSTNCATFTPGGTLDTAKAAELRPTPSTWEGVPFICNLNNVVDNQVGTGSSSGVNAVTLSGPTSGTHHYFFLYIDRNIQPDYSILYNVIQTFKAK